MDTLRRDDIARANAAEPPMKVRQALQAMRFGIRIQRAKLRMTMPDAPEEAIAKALREWLRGDDRAEP